MIRHYRPIAPPIAIFGRLATQQPALRLQLSVAQAITMAAWSHILLHQVPGAPHAMRRHPPWLLPSSNRKSTLRRKNAH